MKKKHTHTHRYFPLYRSFVCWIVYIIRSFVSRTSDVLCTRATIKCARSNRAELKNWRKVNTRRAAAAAATTQCTVDRTTVDSSVACEPRALNILPQSKANNKIDGTALITIQAKIICRDIQKPAVARSSSAFRITIFWRRLTSHNCPDHCVQPNDDNNNNNSRFHFLRFCFSSLWNYKLRPSRLWIYWSYETIQP